MTESKQTLERVKQGFAKWREGKVNKSERIPESLLSLVDGLFSEYSVAEIAKVLSLDYTKTKERFKRQDIIYGQTTGMFIELKNPVKAKESSKVIYERTDGTRMILDFNGDVNIDNLIERFLGYKE